MLWLYNDKFNLNDLIEFYQVFINYDLVYDDEKDNRIYLFDSTAQSAQTAQSNLKINLNDYICDNVISDIKIIEHIISYDIIMPNLNKKNYVFTSKTIFIKPNDNKLNLPIFNHVYKFTNKNRLPNLIESGYNISSTLNFKIYRLDKNNQIQWIVENNPLTNTTRNYFITTDLNLIKQYI